MSAVSVPDQLLAFLQSVLLGLSAGVVYDLLRPFRRRWPRATPWLDGGYSLGAAAAAFAFLLRRGGGVLRWFLALGAAGGAVLFFAAFSALLRPVWEFWAETLWRLTDLLSFPL